MMVEEFNTGFFDIVVQLEVPVLYSLAQISKKLQLVFTLLWNYMLVYQCHS